MTPQQDCIIVNSYLKRKLEQSVSFMDMDSLLMTILRQQHILPSEDTQWTWSIWEVLDTVGVLG